jgi:hypothetical protein
MIFDCPVSCEKRMRKKDENKRETDFMTNTENFSPCAGR